jgi:hypothetical protein
VVEYFHRDLWARMPILVILQIISLVGAVALAVKLFVTGLRKRYPIFFLYFVFRSFNTAWPLLIDVKSNQYLHVWMATEPIAWIFHILVVIELYRLVLEDHKGIYTLGRWAMYAALAIVAIPISILSVIPHFTVHTQDNTKLMGIYFATERGIDFSLALFLLLILFFLSRYPINLSRNVVVHSALYTALFFSDAFAVFLRTFKIVAELPANIVLLGLGCSCVFAWLILLSPHGEEVQANFPYMSPQREKNALLQLASLNATLLKVAGK